MKISSGMVSILGILEKGLVLNEVHVPDSIKFLITESLDSSEASRKDLKETSEVLFKFFSITIERNDLRSPRFISAIFPETGEVNLTPGFFYLQISPVLLLLRYPL